MSAFLLILDATGDGKPARPILRDDFTSVGSPMGQLFLFGPSATLVARDARQLLAHHGEWLSHEETEALKSLEPTPDAGWKDQRGTVVRVDGAGREAHIATDLLGSFPVFYAVDASGTRFVAGSHFAEVRAQIDSAMDRIGCYQFLTGAFCVGNRTLAEGVRQLTVQESLSLSVHGSSIQVRTRVHPVLWTSTSQPDRKQVHDSLTDVWLGETALLDHTQLMMSAGWDSRALLAGITANGLQDSLLAYSHGDVEGRELRLAGRMCEAVGARHVRTPVSQELFNPEIADRVLTDTDSYLFPYWWRAAEIGRKQYGVARMTGGLYGAVLGGHNNVPDKGSEGVRLRALARYLAGGRHPANGDPEAAFAAAGDMIRPSRYHRLWCLTEEFHQGQEPWMLEAVQADTESVLEGYRSTGIDTVEHLVEAFEVDHKLRQYMNGQLRSGAGHLPVRNPFTNPDLVRIATSLPLAAKVHNKLHQAIIRRVAPALLRYPMAATLVPASAPISLQEISRVQRVLLERVTERANRLSKGRIRQPRLGWTDFRFLRDHQPFHDIVDSLKLDVWDRKRMHRVIRESPGNLHPLFDMMGRCKTLDFRLAATR